MTMPYYASPEQLMRDRSEYARKGISRGRSVAVLTYADGVLFIAENPSSTLHKVGELYDRIGFAAVGRYSEFESLRVAGVRLADVRGYSYNRRDVTGRVIANAYAQTLGAIFTEQTKPYEVELCVAEVGDHPENDQLYRPHLRRLHRRRARLRRHGRPGRRRHRPPARALPPGMGLSDALEVGVRALSAVSPVTAGSGNGGPTRLTAAQLEVAVLDRRRPKRAFRRITGSALRTLLGDEARARRRATAAPPPRTPPSVPEPGTPPGLGDPANPDTAGGRGRDPRTDRSDRCRPTGSTRTASRRRAKLIDAGKYDDDTEWSDAAPSADDENAEIEKHGYDGLRRLAPRDRPGRLRGDQGRYAFPYGDFAQGQPGRPHPRQAAGRPERPRRDREGRRPLLERTSTRSATR